LKKDPAIVRKVKLARTGMPRETLNFKKIVQEKVAGFKRPGSDTPEHLRWARNIKGPRRRRGKGRKIFNRLNICKSAKAKIGK